MRSSHPTRASSHDAHAEPASGRLHESHGHQRRRRESGIAGSRWHRTEYVSGMFGAPHAVDQRDRRTNPPVHASSVTAPRPLGTPIRRTGPSGRGASHRAIWARRVAESRLSAPGNANETLRAQMRTRRRRLWHRLAGYVGRRSLRALVGEGTAAPGVGRPAAHGAGADDADTDRIGSRNAVQFKAVPTRSPSVPTRSNRPRRVDEPAARKRKLQGAARSRAGDRCGRWAPPAPPRELRRLKRLRPSSTISGVQRSTGSSEQLKPARWRRARPIPVSRHGTQGRVRPSYGCAPSATARLCRLPE
jgi:hypothetical protein